MPIQTIAERCWTLFAVTVYAGILSTYTVLLPYDEVVLTIGQSYDQVRQKSRSSLPARNPDGFWGGFVERPAVLRFDDAQYGFVTPAANFLFVGVDRGGNVDSITLSPQVKTLPLEPALDIVFDLQHQFLQHGWIPFRRQGQRRIEDTPATREKVRKCAAPTAYWQAADKYQVTVNIRCFRSDARPNEERYLITLQLGPPIFKDYGDEEALSPHGATPYEPSRPLERFSKQALANLANADERMEFVRRAANRFHELLRDPLRSKFVENSLFVIAHGNP